MTLPAVRFPFVSRDLALRSASLAPMMPLTLKGTQPVPVSALLDAGAAVNVLPHGLGTQLGFNWGRQTTTVRLSGNLASVEARVILVDATVATFPPVRLAIARAREDAIPVLLGQVNFFLESDDCFFRSRPAFEVRPKS